MIAYPPRNPFPSRATMIMEENIDDAELLNLELTGPTVSLRSVTRLTDLVRRYLVEASDRSLRGRGQAAFLHGAHGSGKTHAIRSALGRVADEADRARALRLYVKAQDADFTALYRRLMGQVGRARLRDISLGFLGALAADRADGEAEPEILASVRADPEQVHRLFTELVVERGAVLEARAYEVARVADDGEEFERALTCLLDPALEDAAYEWLAGRAVMPVDAERLGVSGPLADPDRCRYGLQLLTAMCARIGRPIIMVIDQCEKLVVDNTANVGHLHSLVERIPRDNGMIILAGAEAAWDAAPPDLRQRFGQHRFDTALVSPREARDLIAAYIRSVAETTQAVHPFTSSAFPELLTLSGGNVRQLLQLCWQAFEVAAPRHAEIDGELVRRAAGHEPPSAEDARHAIEGWLHRAQVVFQSDWRDGDLAADYLVVSSAGPSLFIQISSALLGSDDVHRAVGGVNLLERLRQRGWTAQVVLVVLGYASPGALVLLRRRANEVVVFDGPQAVDRLRAITRGLAPLSVAPPDRAMLELVQAGLRRIRESRREDQERALSASLTFTDDPADLFVRLYEEMSDDCFQGWTAMEWFDDPEVIGRADAIRALVLEHGLLDSELVKAIVAEEGDRGRFMILLGLDAALTLANPYGPYHDAPALAAIVVRYLVEGRFNSEERDGALLPRCVQPVRPRGRRAKPEFFGVHRVPPELWERVEQRVLPAAHDIHVNRDEPVPVGCVPLLETFDDVELRFEKRYGLTVYRLGPRDSSGLRTRIRTAIERLDASGARLAVLPEAALSDGLLEVWKEIAYETADREHALRYLLLGSGPMGPHDPPANRAVLLDRWTGTELLVQDKLSAQTLTAEQMRQWRLLPGAPDVGTAEEYIVTGSRVSVLDSALGRLAVLIGEDLARTVGWEHELGSCGVSHLFAPIFSKPILEHRWEHVSAERWTYGRGSWVTVATSLVVGSALPAEELPLPRRTCLISGLGDDSIQLQFGTAEAGDVPAVLGPGRLPAVLPGAAHDRWQDDR